MKKAKVTTSMLILGNWKDKTEIVSLEDLQILERCAKKSKTFKVLKSELIEVEDKVEENDIER